MSETTRPTAAETRLAEIRARQEEAARLTSSSQKGDVEMGFRLEEQLISVDLRWLLDRLAALECPNCHHPRHYVALCPDGCFCGEGTFAPNDRRLAESNQTIRRREQTIDRLKPVVRALVETPIEQDGAERCSVSRRLIEQARRALEVERGEVRK